MKREARVKVEDGGEEGEIGVLPEVGEKAGNIESSLELSVVKEPRKNVFTVIREHPRRLLHLFAKRKKKSSKKDQKKNKLKFENTFLTKKNLSDNQILAIEAQTQSFHAKKVKKARFSAKQLE